MLYDLTITLDENTLPFPDSGDPHMTWKHLVDHTIYKCQVSLFSMVTHLGTHVDAPLHYVKEGKTTAQMDLDRYCGEAVCIDASENIPADGFWDISDLLEKNRAFIGGTGLLILYTGWENRVGTKEYFDFPDFHPNSGKQLEDAGIRGLGLDMPSIGRNPLCHHGVLVRDIAVYESLINLKPLIGKRFYFSAVPLKFADGDGSPVRAYAVTDDE